MFAKIFSSKDRFSYSQDTIDTLRLIRSENIGNKTFFDLIKLFGNSSEAIKHVEEMSVRGGRKKPIKLFSLDSAHNEVIKANELGVRIIAYNDDLYPKMLGYISDAPPIINALGNVSLLNSKCIAIVGSRNCSISGIQFTQKISKDISDAGITIVSGFARGIDTAAHQAALENPTIAVLAGGIDHIYPQENKDLYHKIANTGCIVAELPIGSSPSSQHFPQRNRIISGLSLATVVIEASIGSGSLITANLALDQGREVFAVPGFPSDPRYKGNNKLLKQGAMIIESAEDVLSNLPNFKLEKFSSSFEESNDNKYIATIQNISDISLSARAEILGLLSNVPIEIEVIAKYAQMPLSLVYLIIVELELAGKIFRHPGNKVSLQYEI
jgi:DNA processing protein